MAKRRPIGAFKPISPLTLEKATSAVVGRASKIDSFVTAMKKAKEKGYSITSSTLEDAKFAKTIAKLQGDWNLDGILKADIYNAAQMRNERIKSFLVSAEVASKRAALTKELKNIGLPEDFMEDKKALEAALDIFEKCVNNLFEAAKRRIDMVYPDEKAFKKAQIELYGAEIIFDDKSVDETQEDEIIQEVVAS